MTGQLFPFPPKIVPVQPMKVDWSNPLTNELIAAFLPGVSRNDLTGINRPLVDLSTVSPILGPEGWRYHDSSAGASVLGTGVDRLINWNEFTIFMRFFMVAGTTVNCFVGVVSNASANCAIAITANAANNGVQTDSLAFTVETSTDTGVLATGVYHNYTNAQQGTTHNAYLNGVLLNSGVGGTSVPSALSNAQIAINGDGGTGVQPAAIYMWRRRIYLEEILQVERNPYGAFLVPAFDWPGYSAFKAASFTGFDMTVQRDRPVYPDYSKVLESTTHPVLPLAFRTAVTPSTLVQNPTDAVPDWW